MLSTAEPTATATAIVTAGVNMPKISSTTWQLWATYVSLHEFVGEEVDKHNAELERLVIEGCAAQKGSEQEKRLSGLHLIESPSVDWLIQQIKIACAEYYRTDAIDKIRVGLRGVLLEDYDHINTHTEASESDVGVAYWASGNKIGAELNSKGDGVNEPIFKLEDPSRASTDARLPYEHRHSVDLCPRAGLLALYPTYLPHNVHPYRGKKPFVQIVAQVRMNIDSDKDFK